MPSRKATATLLKEYGYIEQDGVFVPARPSSERWQTVEGGFLCFAPAAPTFGGGQPWGRDTEDGYVQVPFKQSARFEGVSGLHPVTHPDAFDWVWPEERVREIYEYASVGESNPWRKTDAGYVKE